MRSNDSIVISDIRQAFLQVKLATYTKKVDSTFSGRLVLEHYVHLGMIIGGHGNEKKLSGRPIN